jgi:hypothetical protein
MCLIDLDEIDAVFASNPLWSTRRGRPVQFRRGDFLGDPEVELKVAVRRKAEEAFGPLGDGRVQLLTQLRTWGWCFNPISIYYCFNVAGQLSGAVASVSNTPWGEHHDYALEAAGAGIDATVPKAMHVSPFIAMDRTYRFLLSPPGDRLEANVDVLEGEEVRLTTSLHLKKQALDRSAMTSLLVSYPFMAWRVSAAIYWQAARLRRKGAHFYSHPGSSDPSSSEQLTRVRS